MADATESGDEPPFARSAVPRASQLPMAITSALAPGAEGQDAPEGTAAVVLTFEQLYQSSYASLVRLAYVLTGSREVAEDLVQDSFVRLHHHFHRVDAPDRYVKAMVVNACRSHFRRAGRERDKRPLLYVVNGSETAGSSGAHQGELHDVLMQLPYRQRAAIVLRYYGDLSEIEIAEVLGCRPGTVGSLIHRSLERLRTVLEP
jgi:RNA polymerase sigma-70 factor (sigma-E family)